ncbi:MAG: sugar kinase [Pontibacterium sp.]
MKPIITCGEILVEVMAKEKDQAFIEIGEYLGPYPSGAPAIFINQVAKLNTPAAIIGSVGNDDFGSACLKRLTQNGVDTSLIQVDPERPTGTAFVTYEQSGDRAFIFNIAHSAAGQVSLSEVSRARLKNASVFHVMGSSVFSTEAIALLKEAMGLAKEGGALISFDPNVRKELLGDKALFSFFKDVLAQTDIFLPSGEELFDLTGTQTESEALEAAFALGVSEIVLKKGHQGCAYFSPTEHYRCDAYKVDEVDATGAGDTFGATFIAARQNGIAPHQALMLANASGAMAVSAWGPMEGAANQAQIESFIASFA